jgi:hypothetical protein
MKNLHIRFAASGVVVVLLCACNGFLGWSGEGQRLGIISFYNDPIVIEVPDTVASGLMFQVRVRTYGGGCITQGHTDVRVDGLRVTVTPYDIHSGGNVCTTELRLFQHEAAVRFDRVGTATVAVRGMRRPDDQTITEERTVVVN